MDAISLGNADPETAAVSDRARARERHLSEPERLAALVAWAIRRQTGTRVEALDVRVEPAQVVVTGRCPTFYCKQLAQTAAMRVLGCRQLSNCIEVD